MCSAKYLNIRLHLGAMNRHQGMVMKKWSFWQKDWFVGLLVALVFLFGANSDLMQSLERKAYDLGVLASSRTPSDKIAVIAIDDQSIANLGRWPWPREIHAKMIDILAAGHAKVIGNTVFFSEPQVDAGLELHQQDCRVARQVNTEKFHQPGPSG